MSVIQSLPRLRWRGLVAPEYDIASFDFSTGLVPRRYPYISRASHDNVQRDSHSLTFKLYFLNSLTTEAFPQLWDEWRPFLFDGEAGEMVHPVLGPLQARSGGGRVNVEARTTAGIIVDVSFVETMLDPAEAIDEYTTQASRRALAAAAQAAVSDADIPWPDGAIVTDLLDSIDMLEGALYSLELTAEGYANQILGTIGGLIESTRNLGEHQAYAAADILLQLWSAVKDAADEAAVTAARATGTATATSQTTIDALARKHTNTVAEMMTLNPDLLGSSVIASGTAYRYFIGAPVLDF